MEETYHEKLEKQAKKQRVKQKRNAKKFGRGLAKVTPCTRALMDGLSIRHIHILLLLVLEI